MRLTKVQNTFLVLLSSKVTNAQRSLNIRGCSGWVQKRPLREVGWLSEGHDAGISSLCPLPLPHQCRSLFLLFQRRTDRLLHVWGFHQMFLSVVSLQQIRIADRKSQFRLTFSYNCSNEGRRGMAYRDLQRRWKMLKSCPDFF